MLCFNEACAQLGNFFVRETEHYGLEGASRQESSGLAMAIFVIGNYFSKHFSVGYCNNDDEINVL